ncbi:MAG: PqqD family protein [Blastocatellia bacterium]
MTDISATGRESSVPRPHTLSVPFPSVSGRTQQTQEAIPLKHHHNTSPCAREGSLIVREIRNEVLVYDLRTHKAHCLNELAAAVWQRCDGRQAVPEITRLLRREFDKRIDERVVWTAVDQLGKANLLESRIAPPLWRVRFHTPRGPAPFRPRNRIPVATGYDSSRACRSQRAIMCSSRRVLHDGC